MDIYLIFLLTNAYTAEWSILGFFLGGKKKRKSETTRFSLGLLWAGQSRIFLFGLLLFLLAPTLPPILAIVVFSFSCVEIVLVCMCAVLLCMYAKY